MTTLKGLEQEIDEIKSVLGEAINEGRNSLAIWGKFDNLFNAINELQNEIANLKQKVKDLKEIAPECDCETEISN